MALCYEDYVSNRIKDMKYNGENWSIRLIKPRTSIYQKILRNKWHAADWEKKTAIHVNGKRL